MCRSTGFPEGPGFALLDPVPKELPVAKRPIEFKIVQFNCKWVRALCAHIGSGNQKFQVDPVPFLPFTRIRPSEEDICPSGWITRESELSDILALGRLAHRASIHQKRHLLGEP